MNINHKKAIDKKFHEVVRGIPSGKIDSILIKRIKNSSERNVIFIKVS